MFTKPGRLIFVEILLIGSFLRDGSLKGSVEVKGVGKLFVVGLGDCSSQT